MQPPRHEETRPSATPPSKRTETGHPTTSYQQKGIHMSTPDRTQSTTAPHPAWCDLERCGLDPIDGTRFHVSAPSTRYRDEPGAGYDLSTTLHAADGEQAVYADLSLTTELLSAAGVRQLITDLTALEREMLDVQQPAPVRIETDAESYVRRWLEAGHLDPTGFDVAAAVAALRDVSEDFKRIDADLFAVIVLGSETGVTR